MYNETLLFRAGHVIYMVFKYPQEKRAWSDVFLYFTEKVDWGRFYIGIMEETKPVLITEHLRGSSHYSFISKPL